MKRRVEDPDRAASSRWSSLLVDQHDRRRQPDQARRGDGRRRRDARAARRRRPGGREAPTPAPAPEGADRAPALLRLLAALVGRARAAAHREPPGDPHRPARLRRLGEARQRLLDRRAGGARRRGADRLGVQGAVVVGHSMGASSPPRWPRARASSSTGSSSSTRARRPSDCCAAVPRPARLHAGARRGDLAADAGLRWSRTATRTRSRPASTSTTASRTPTRSSTTTDAMTYTSFNDADDASDDFPDDDHRSTTACASSRCRCW